ncbi:putative sugar transporter [Calycina marina]|uniref:Sugar transporter n=1 Tax=Calycina marina TaxID=1763456 RepID=A0A9P8CCP6_9HELO|nr:putative sugar transporter [Calycina marina]
MSYSENRDLVPAVKERKREPFRKLLENNELGIIDSPLQWIDPEIQDVNVRKTHRAYRLASSVSEDMLVRGARLARDEELFLSGPDVTQFDRDVLAREKTSTVWQQSKEMKIILLTCCVAAIAQGWDQASITGANLLWPADMGLEVNLAHPEKGLKTGDVWKFGGVNAITYFAASSLGAWISDPLNEYLYGRRGALFVAGIFSFVGVIGCAFCHSWHTLFVCRALVGIGMGAKASVVPIFESEIAPARIRGKLLVSWQTFTALGIALGNAANLILRKYWRWQTASGFVPAVILLTLVFMCSESPRWLIKQGNYRKAFEVLVRLRRHELLAARDLYYIHAQIQVEASLFSKRADVETQLHEWGTDANHDMYQEEFKKTSAPQRVLQLFTINRNRRAALASFVVMAAQQMSGINVFAFLAASFLADAGLSSIDSLWLSLGFGIANFIFSPIAYWFIDSKGRRFLLLASLLGCFPMLLATGFSFNIQDKSAKIGVVATFLMLFTLAYSPGGGVIPFLYSSEIWPLLSREGGMSWACFWNFFLAGILALTVPSLTKSIGNTRVLGVFAGLDVVAFVAVWLLVPGTQEITTLEDMNYVFGVPTRRHVEYQVKSVLPWKLQQITHQSTRRKPAALYRWEKNRQRVAGTNTAAAVQRTPTRINDAANPVL